MRRKIFTVFLFLICTFQTLLFAQSDTTTNKTDVVVATQGDTQDPPPVISYSVAARKCEIADIKISGLVNSMYEDFVLVGFSGLSVGQMIEVPGSDITNAVKRFWKQGLFSDVAIAVTKLEGNKVWLEIRLKDRPRITDINYYGMKNSERKDIEARIGFIRGNQITPNQLDRAKDLIKKYYDEKGFNDALVDITQTDDLSKENHVYLNINVNKKTKIKVHDIIIEGNELVSASTLERSMKKTRHKSNFKSFFRNFLRSTNYVPESYEEDKENLIKKYNELGYRDAQILEDTVTKYNDKKVDIHIKVEEGQKYFIRDITWIGNTEYATDVLQAQLAIKPGDVYNQSKISQRLTEDEDAVGNLFYYNKGYVFYHADPVEANIEKDSVDLEIRITEGPQAKIRKVTISGNDRLYEDVVRRELRTKPGALFSREDLMRSYREIAQMGHFDPENIKPNPVPDPETGTIDIGWDLASKANDQVEFSAGWGQTGIIGKLSLKFSNFSLKNLFNKGSYKGFLPQGEGQTLTLSAQTNADYYQSYSISFMDPWFGGKRPNSLSVGAYYSVMTGVNYDYYNNSLYNSLYGYGYGYGNDNAYQSSLDPDKSMKTLGLSVAYGKRLKWPDDYFYAQAELSYQRYSMKNWTYQTLIRDGVSNNLSINLTLARNSTDNPVFTRTGSQFTLTAQLTPPFSLLDGKDYANMPKDEEGYETEKKFKWVEYHKWKFKAKTFTSLVPSITKTPVLMTRTEFGMVGYYNKHKKSPFETFYVGGDGMTGSYSSYATETVALRGYENGSLGYQASAYARLGLELRYPIILEPTSTIYILSFLEAGNAWSDINKINPFDLKRSAGVGVRVMLPMIGLLGIDWAYGFDALQMGSGKSREYSGSQLHFIIGQEF
ncbi:outer membrane protein assembly factor [Dysgonomonas sp. 520]|uniref:BamA/OMP85 family outer membrane protein n=1 Tax=Dysgonomonas sp. 520 TaxID=2302931 RepID=UPI0013D8191B|nr:POTRA domain-containing protein [Dysgonomonas sp. 520]NDW08780.1 outer membrane protein assembly factor BamA [Dysgonomonas sp. 520]